MQGQDPTKPCAPPPAPGRAGLPVNLLCNQFKIQFDSNNSLYRYRVQLTKLDNGTAQQPPDSSLSSSSSGSSSSSSLVDGPLEDAASAAAGGGGGDPPGIPLSMREDIMQRLAGQQNWSTDAWQFDPGSNTLYSNTSDLLGDTSSETSGPWVVSLPGRKKEGPKYKVGVWGIMHAVHKVGVTPDTGAEQVISLGFRAVQSTMCTMHAYSKQWAVLP